MRSLYDEVKIKLAQLSTQRGRFVIRSESLPADLALLGLLDEVLDAASVAFELSQVDELFAAFPRVRTVFEAAQRLVVLAAEDDYVRVGARAWLYYLRKDMEIAEFARGTEAATEWYESTFRQWRHLWAQHHPDAETILGEERALLETPARSRKQDNFVRKDLGQSVAECYSKLGLASGRSVIELRELNRGIYAALSRESHARLRLDPVAVSFLDDGTVKVIPRKTDEALRKKTLLGCLDSSLAESIAALHYLTPIDGRDSVPKAFQHAPFGRILSPI